MPSTCIECHRNLPKRENLSCAYCHNTYNLECANVSTKRFNNGMSTEYQKKWKCRVCHCKTPNRKYRHTQLYPKNQNNIQ